MEFAAFATRDEPRVTLVCDCAVAGIGSSNMIVMISMFVNGGLLGDDEAAEAISECSFFVFFMS